MKTILIIEDDKILRENTADFLKEEGFEVIAADDGLIGLQWAVKKFPDLILCDISMPNMNGYDFYKAIQQINYMSAIPFIFLTAKAEMEDIREGMRLGVDDYMTKPFDLNELLKVIDIRLAKYEKIQKVNDEKFKALVESPIIGIYIYQKDKFVYYNETLAEIFGFSYEEFKSFTFEDILNEKYKDEVLCKIDECFNESQSSIKLEFEAVHKTRDNLSVELYGTIINYKGIVSLAGNILDLGRERNSLSAPKIIVDNSDNFSKRELEVLQLVYKGKTALEISEKLFISYRTVEVHRAKLLSKSGCKKIAELIVYANKRHLINID